MSDTKQLYGLESLAAAPDAPVLIVQGNEAAEAVAKILTKWVVVTWSGGLSGIHDTDWTPILTRKIDLWPNASELGTRTIAKVQERLIELGVPKGRTFVPGDRNSGWTPADAAIEYVTQKALIGWFKRDSGKWIAEWTTPEAMVVSGSAGADPTPEQASSPLSSKAASADSAPALSHGTLDSILSIEDRRAMWVAIGMDYDQIDAQGKAPANEYAVYTFCKYLKDMFWLDTFLQQPMTTWGGKGVRPANDEVIASLVVFFQSKLGVARMGKEKIKGGLAAWGLENKRNVAQEWLHGLQWDGVARLNVMLPVAFGTADDDYHAAVGRCFMVGLANRVLNPGCQMDYAPVFESEEGTGKTTAMSILGGEWYGEAQYKISHLDFYQCLRGKMIVELGEMAAIDRASVEEVKACLSRRTDTYRQSYGYVPGDYPRSNVFTMTTNRDDWNRSTTGARRFWRVVTGKIDLSWLREYREQLFAEAAHRAKAGECYWDVPIGEQKKLADDARTRHPWEELIQNWMLLRPDNRQWAKTSEIFEMLGLTPDKQTRIHAHEIGKIMGMYGYISRTTRDGGGTFKAWHKRRLDIVGPAPGSAADEGTPANPGPEETIPF